MLNDDLTEILESERERLDPNSESYGLSRIAKLFVLVFSFVKQG